MMSNNYRYFAGLDVSKDTIDLFILPEGQYETIKNNKRGIKKAVKLFSTYENVLVVLESTGGYERGIAHALAEQDIPVSRVNPQHIHHYSKAAGRHAKTDKIDAQTIAMYAKMFTPKPNIVLQLDQDELRELEKRRDQLKKGLCAENNRKQKACSETTKKSVQRIIDVLTDELKTIEKQLQKRVSENNSWKTQRNLYTSMNGVANKTAASLIALLPELGTLGRRQIASLCGLAPYNQDSGKKRGKRSIKGGRHLVRKALYMATLSATNFNPVIKKKYRELLNRGKLKKVAMTACMRLMLGWLNAMARDNKTWQEMNVYQNAIQN